MKEYWIIEEYNDLTHEWEIRVGEIDVPWLNYKSGVTILKLWYKDPFINLTNFRMKHIESGNAIPAVLLV